MNEINWFQTDDVRVNNIEPLVSPAILIKDYPATPQIAEFVSKTRDAASEIIHGNDDRLLVVVGPCSIHDSKSAVEYAQRLHGLIERFKEDLLIVMRVYFEKPRTTVGWKGLINDPLMDGSYDINKGLNMARGLLLRIAELGVPSATEFLDTITPQYMADLIVWGAIGARTTESQVHRELASGLSMPVGFKNGTTGCLQIAVDAVVSASCPHCFLSVTKQGVSAIVNTAGNQSCHLILRGSSDATNYDEGSVKKAWELQQKAGITNRLMIDFSHGNSCKNFKNQPIVGRDVARQIAEGSDLIAAVMIESFLKEGRQKISEEMEYGKSVTDACLGWDDSVKLLEELADAVRKRRALKKQ